MVINTNRFGEITIDINKVITFPHGILGFEEYKRYILIHEENSIFSFLQCLDQPELAFVVIMPELIKPDYQVYLESQYIKDLKLDDVSDGSVYGIITIPENLADMTINLQAPLVINTKTLIGKQIVLADEKYSTRHNIIAELQKANFERGRQNQLKQVISKTV